MAIINALDRVTGIIQETGRTGLNILFPKEFELYLCALELVDQDMKTLQYFVFPTMPSNMEESQSKITNVKQTMGGVSSISTPLFIPRTITLSGTFGRSMKLLVGDLYESIFEAQSFMDGASGAVRLDKRIKTGYGCIKILEEMFERESDTEGGIKTLILHNPAIGNSYIVKPNSLKLAQSEESNMVWNYSMTMQGVAPLDSIKNVKAERMELLAKGVVQKTINMVIGNLTKKIG